MKPSIHRLLLAVFAIGLCSDSLAGEKRDYPRVSLVTPGSSKDPAPKEDYVILVVEGDNLLFDKKPIPTTGTVDFVNELLRVRNVKYIGLCAREGTRFKDVVHAIDALRGTNATNIGISMNEVPVGRDP